MTDNGVSNTRALFEALIHLYEQGQLLLLDSDRLMQEKGWEARGSIAVSSLSTSINSPRRWYPRWAVRFYSQIAQKEADAINRLLFVSIHFASDGDYTVEDPLVSAGRLLFNEPKTDKESGNSWDYWQCRYWFLGHPSPTLEGWHVTGQSKPIPNVGGSETFIVPLYEIGSPEDLARRVVDPLLARDEESASESPMAQTV